MTLSDACYKLEVLLALLTPEGSFPDDHPLWNQVDTLKRTCAQVDAVPSGPCDVSLSLAETSLGHLVNNIVGDMITASRPKFKEDPSRVAGAHKELISIAKMFPRPTRPARVEAARMEERR